MAPSCTLVLEGAGGMLVSEILLPIRTYLAKFNYLICWVSKVCRVESQAGWVPEEEVYKHFRHLKSIIYSPVFLIP